MNVLIWFLGFSVLLILVFFTVATLYSYRLLPREGRTTVDGITTIEDAVRVCQESGKTGWELVEFARWISARKFTYSRRNHWDSPERAFERGMGYCIQQAYALKLLYDGLGIQSQLVHAFRNRFSGGEVHGISEPGKIFGHAWLRVRVGDEERNVCPGREANRFGALHFEPLSKVLPYAWWFHLVAHPGSVAVNFILDITAGQRAARRARFRCK
ncbi:MAG: hypothetical protein MUO76_19015 [Anaerolineaceae bacterium]|nr:hypothetical protein [Anaerolineaceae bacterium]